MASQHVKVTVKSRQLRTPKLRLKMPKLALGKNNGKRKA